MGDSFLFLLVFFLIVATVTRETFIFSLLYLFAGAFLIGRWWLSQVIHKTTIKRIFTNKAFPGERIPIKLQIANNTILPAIWLYIRDNFPPEVATGPRFEQVISLGPRGKMELSYVIQPHKRGYYQMGPTLITSGDLLGLVGETTREGNIASLIVYPRVLPLTSFGLPSRSPLGTLKHHLPIFEDPTRPTGKRDYVRGDSLRRIDWKASAATGRLQVKQFEPSIALETAIFLNLNGDEYYQKTRYDMIEFAIVLAASIANWTIQNKQDVGLITNGLDPLGVDEHTSPIFPNKGRSQLMQILESLARIKSTKASPQVDLLRLYRKKLGWGTTVVHITGQVNEELFDELLQVSRAGLNPVLMLCGEQPEISSIKTHAKRAGIPFHHLRSELDLYNWQDK